MRKYILIYFIAAGFALTSHTANFLIDPYGSFMLPKTRYVSLVISLHKAILDNNRPNVLAHLLAGASKDFGLFHDGISYDAFQLAFEHERWHILEILQNFSLLRLNTHMPVD